VTRRRLHAARIAALALFLLAATPAAAGALPGRSFFGVNIQPLIKFSFVPYSNWGAFISTMASDDLSTARMDVQWYWVEPNPPTAAGHTYIWDQPASPQASMDNLISLLASNHVRLSAVIDSPPPWAAGRGTMLSAAYYGDFAAFAAAFAARYGVDGSFWKANPALPYLPVLDFEVWDEANSADFWSGAPDPSAYAAAFAQVSAAIHAVDPSATVLASIGWQNFQSYVSQLYATGIASSIDGIGFHPYAPDAPGIMLLNEQLRATLASAGAASLPIYDTETGQPVVRSGRGAEYAYDGEVTDAARAATESLAGDALARSDCGVDDYLIYGITGSGTGLEPNDEGFMGIFNAATDMPDRTGSALIAASKRWRAHRHGGIVLCGSGTTPARDLLRLGVRLSRPGPTCAAATVSYHGNPLEGAELVLRTADGRVASAATNAYGQASVCLQNGPAINHFTADAELHNVATSVIHRCPVSTAPCRAIHDAARKP